MNTKKQAAVEKLNELIKNIKTAMLTTIDGGMLRSRPMASEGIDTDGTLWFLTSSATHKDEEILRDNRVNISYAALDANTFVSVSGTAAILLDREKIGELWAPFHKAWFPKGQTDPNIRVLKVDVDQAEYWDAFSGSFVEVAGFLKALATGESAGLATENKKLNL